MKLESDIIFEKECPMCGLLNEICENPDRIVMCQRCGWEYKY